MSSVVVIDHIFFWNTKIFKIPTKVDADATDYFMGLNENEQELGGINKDSDVTDDQEPKEVITNANVTDADTDAGMGLNYYAIFIVINSYYWNPRWSLSIEFKNR